MSPYQEKDQSGTLFNNDRKERESQPDFTGKAIVNGVPVYVSGWKKENGRISLAFKNREPGAFEKKEEPAKGGQIYDADDSIPF